MGLLAVVIAGPYFIRPLGSSVIFGERVDITCSVSIEQPPLFGESIAFLAGVLSMFDTSCTSSDPSGSFDIRCLLDPLDVFHTASRGESGVKPGVLRSGMRSPSSVSKTFSGGFRDSKSACSSVPSDAATSSVSRMSAQRFPVRFGVVAVPALVFVRGVLKDCRIFCPSTVIGNSLRSRVAGAAVAMLGVGLLDACRIF
jgi:hypothetical protein